MSNLAWMRFTDGASAILVLVAATAFAFIAMWPVDDGVAVRMADGAWLAEAFRRFLFLASCALGGGVLILLWHLALHRLTSVGSIKRAGKWAFFSMVALLLVSVAATWRFWVVRPWF